jgi:hypothetical protein
MILDEAFVASFPDIYMYGSAEAHRLSDKVDVYQECRYDFGGIQKVDLGFECFREDPEEEFITISTWQFVLLDMFPGS